MTIPNVNATVKDNPGGQAFGDNPIWVVGNSSIGTAGTNGVLYSRWEDAATDYGYGIGIEALAFYTKAGIPCYFCKTPNTTAGTAGSVTFAGTGTADLTVTGAPFDHYSVIAKCAVAGSTDTSPYPAIQVSLDGGLTYGPVVRLSSLGVYAPPHTGLTLTWTIVSPNLTMVVGDTWAFDCVAPIWGSSDLTTAMAAIAAKPQLAGHFRDIHIVGAASAANAGTVDTAVQAQYAADQFNSVTMDSVDFGSNTESQWITALQADFLSFTSANGRVAVGASPCYVQSPISGSYLWRAVSWYAVRAFGRNTIGADVSAPVLGALGGLVDLQVAGVRYPAVKHDENVLGGLDNNRFITVRTINGRQGYYITNPNTMAALGSQYALKQAIFQMNLASFVGRDFFLDALSVPQRVDSAGHIIEDAARALEIGNDGREANALLNPGYISAGGQTDGTFTKVSRTDNLLATNPVMHVSIKLLSLAYPKDIELELSFAVPNTIQV